MKRLIFSLFILFSFQGFTQIHCSKSCQPYQKSNMAFRANQSAEDITYLAANWTVNPTEKYISGSIAYSLTILQADYDSLRLDLSDSLMVDSIRTSTGVLPYTHAENQLRIDVADAISSNRVSLEIFYRGTPPTTGFGSLDPPCTKSRMVTRTPGSSAKFRVSPPEKTRLSMTSLSR